MWKMNNPRYVYSSDDELGDLKTELQHQQKKVDEYTALKHELLSIDSKLIDRYAWATFE